MKPKLTWLLPAFALQAAILPAAAAPVVVDVYDGSITDRQETEDSVTYVFHDSVTYADRVTQDTLYGGSVFFNDAVWPDQTDASTLTFTGTGKNIAFVNCVSANADSWINANEGGGAIRGVSVVFSQLGQISFDGCRSVVNANTNAGGAVNARGNLLFSSVGDVSFKNSSLGNDHAQGQALGGAVFANGKVAFDNTGAILFENNTSGHSPTSNHANLGGALYAGASDTSTPQTNDYIPVGEKAVSIVNANGSVIFRGNSAWMAGAVYAYAGAVNGVPDSGGGMIVDRVKGDLAFENNESVSVENGSFGAVYSGLDFEIYHVAGDVRFAGNRARQSVGAFASNRDTTIENVGSLTILGNSAGGNYGAASITGNLTIRNVDGSVTLSNNEAGYHIGGLAVGGKTLMTNTGAITIANNKSGQGTAALQAANGLEISNNAGLLVENNVAGSTAGAFRLYYKDVLLSADRGDTIFRNNVEMRGGDLPYLNAVVISSYNGTVTLDSLALRAREGREVAFYDPIRNDNDGREFDGILFEFNKPDTVARAVEDVVNPYIGTIRFSGEVADQKIVRGEGEAEPDWRERLRASKYFDVSGKTTFYDGTLILEKGVVYGNTDVTRDSSFTARRGTVEITGDSAIYARNISVEPDVVLRTGRGAWMTGESVDFSRGVTFDFRPFMDDNSSGLHIAQAGSMTMGGLVRIADDWGDYVHERWGREQRFLAIALEAGAVHGASGDYDDAQSVTTGSHTVDSPYTYKGIWSLEWEDSDRDGKNDLLYAVWTPTGGPDEPEPELEGMEIGNSMWSSASNIKVVSNAALGQAGAARFLLEPKNNFWVNGLGDFSQQDAKGGIDGYDYSGGGYAVGGDRRICRSGLVGAAFGNLFGKNSPRSYPGKIKQTSYVALLYGAWRREMKSGDALHLAGTAAFGWTQNRMNSYHHLGASTGKWQNRTGFASMQATWEHAMGCGWAFLPFIGVEYTDVRQESFTEAGLETRSFGRGKLRNLSLPVGIGFNKISTTRGGVRWVNSVAVSYVPDVYRKNPESSAWNRENDLRWTAKGSRPDRQAVRVNVGSTAIFNRRWTAFAGYEFEGRHANTAHRVNIGASYAF